MFTRTHIASFIILIVIIWLFILFLKGTTVSLDLIIPFGSTIGIATFIVSVFKKYLWSWRVFKGWYVKCPDLRGTWRVVLKSSWINHNTGKTISPIHGYVVINQTLTTLSFRLMTKESKSSLVAYNIDQQSCENIYKIFGVYRNEPQISLRGVRSEIHYGAFSLEAHGNPIDKLQGNYWTDRATKGEMSLTNRISKRFNSFDEAKNYFNNLAD